MSTAKPMYIELHVLQTFPVSAINRDGAGNPKDALFGGVRRARISSQCFKRSARVSSTFAEETGVPLGVRTRWMVVPLREALTQAGFAAEEVEKVLQGFIPLYFGKLDSDKKLADAGRVATAAFLSQQELDAIVAALGGAWHEILAGNEPDAAALGKIAEKLIKEQVGWTSAPDVALFGRMMAHDPRLQIVAASQTAHAISTHRAELEYDYFTAMDDLLNDAATGRGEASMLATTAYTSATFYRYHRFDWDLLVRNLNGDLTLARQTLKAALLATLEALPTGKISGFAHYTAPDLVLAVAREGFTPWNLVNAFERPVRPSADGYIQPSIERLLDFYEHTIALYGERGLRSVLGSALVIHPGHAVEVDEETFKGQRLPALDQLVEAACAYLKQE